MLVTAPSIIFRMCRFELSVVDLGAQKESLNQTRHAPLCLPSTQSNLAYGPVGLLALLIL